MGSSGGGSASGRTDFPDYMKGYHMGLLGVNSAGAYTGAPFTLSLVDAFNEAATGNSPYFKYTSNQLNPDSLFFPAGKSISDSAYSKPFDLLAALINFDFEATVSAAHKLAADSTWIKELVSSASTTLDDVILNETGPALHSRMRDIGAVMSSAFVIGDTLLQDSKLKALARVRIDIEGLSIQREDLALKYATMVSAFNQNVLNAAADLTKYYHSIRSEVLDTNAEWLAKDLLWDLKLFQYASNPLGAIAGSALAVDHGKGSKVGNAVGGAMAGASIGGTVGGGWGALAGGIVGGAAGYFGSN